MESLSIQGHLLSEWLNTLYYTRKAQPKLAIKLNKIPIWDKTHPKISLVKQSSSYKAQGTKPDFQDKKSSNSIILEWEN